MSQKPKFQIGDVVYIKDEVLEDNYEHIGKVPLLIECISTSKEDHPGYDETANGQALYDFLFAETGEEVPNSLYEYEIDWK